MWSIVRSLCFSQLSLSSLSSSPVRNHPSPYSPSYAGRYSPLPDGFCQVLLRLTPLLPLLQSRSPPLPSPILLRLKRRRPLLGPRVLLKNAMHWRATRSPKGIPQVARSSSERTSQNSVAEGERPPFDINLAVVLAGFAFEAYTSPPKDVGWREVDTADCESVFLSKQFLHEAFDGQLRIKLKKGVYLPAMDPWGTSDTYVVFQVEDLVAKSKVKWALNPERLSGENRQEVQVHSGFLNAYDSVRNRLMMLIKHSIGFE